MTSIVLAGLVLFNSTTSAPAQASYSRTFNGASNYMVVNSAPLVTAFPFTLCAWVKIAGATATTQQIIVALDRIDSSSYQAAIEVTATTGYVSATIKNTGSTYRSTSTVAPTSDTWQHVCGVFTSGTSRTVYLNGTGYTPNTTTASLPTWPNQAQIGAKMASGSTRQSWFNGKIAHVAVWDVALTATEISNLNSLKNPLDLTIYTTGEAPVSYYPFSADPNPGEDVGVNNLWMASVGTAQDTDVPAVEDAP